MRLNCARAFITTSLLVSVAWMAGCGGGEYRKLERYYLVATNINIPYWQTAKAGLLQAAKEIGVVAELVGPETYDPKAQKEKFDELVRSDRPPKGILVAVADPALMTPSINAAVEKGIPVITVDADAPGSKRLFFVGTDNYNAGVQGAERVAQELKRAGTVVIYTIKGQTNLEDRLRGYRDVFATYPAIRILDVIDIRGQATVAFDTTKALIEKDPTRMDAFVCLEAIACPEVAEVLSRNRIKNKVVVAMDTPQRTLEWIQQGVIQATVAQRPYTMAYVGLRMLADLNKYAPQKLTKEGTLATLPEFVNTGTIMVDKSNVEAFLKEVQAVQAEPTAPPSD